MSICPHTGITQPECCCSQCLTAQIRAFQPALLNADPVGEIRVSRTATPRAPQAADTSSPGLSAG